MTTAFLLGGPCRGQRLELTVVERTLQIPDAEGHVQRYELLNGMTSPTGEMLFSYTWAPDAG